ncbi:MAG: DNA gyrase subunit A [SAR202 cluster bacterium]|nr:DNA gyrase subunit A [SAR202 cluster bacterium]
MVTKTAFGFVKPQILEEEMRTSYMQYSMSVIVARALPDVRDGLKPVQRRILYAMNELGMRPNTAYKKSARLVGEVLGKYHPHGEGAVYDAMVRMAQDFSMRVPLVDGQGNFGSVDNDPPAAMRYTEARLSFAAEEMLANIDQETVDYSDNFDGTLQEPVVLPARLPNLLINGAAGIAVGMATNIPPHNPSEVCDGVIYLIDNPDATDLDLMKIITGPDFPTGATIMGRDGIRSAYTTGRGSITVRAVAEIEDMKKSNRQQIVVTDLPYQVNKAALVEKIAALIKEKRLEGITEIRDESDRQGMRMVMELRAGAQALVILNNLYKLTAMQSSFAANMLALVNGMPQVITLRSALSNYISFRREVVTRRTRYELRKALERAHILEGLRIALNNLDAVIKLIRESADVESARQGLMTTFSLSQIQAQAILDMQLRRLAALEREKIENEYQELMKLIDELQALLADPHKIDGVIKKETRDLKKKVGEDRRTTISDMSTDMNREDFEPHEQVVITLSQAGYIKRIAASTYRNQHRGGKGVTSMKTREDDPVRHILVCDTHDTLLYFTNTGRVLSTRVFDLRPDFSRNTRGVPVANVIPLGGDERVNAIVHVRSLQQQDVFLVMGTTRGEVKRVNLAEISSIRKAGLIIMALDQGDELVTARLGHETDDVTFVTENGMSIRFPVGQVTARQRAAGGVRGILLRRGDKVVSMDMVVPDSKLLVVSRNGYGKLTTMDKYKQQNRGGMGVKTMAITDKTGPVAAAQIIADSDELYVVSEQAQVMRTSLTEIRSTAGRVTQGVRIFTPAPGDAVASMACVSALEEVGGGEEALPLLSAVKHVDGKAAKRSANGATKAVEEDEPEESEPEAEEEAEDGEGGEQGKLL